MTSSVTESVLRFDCAGQPLLGILSQPPSGAAASHLGLVIVVGGPQYRAGSHRQFVQLARAVAQAGYPALRFDVRGMGDSPGDQRSFEALSDDIKAAVDAFSQSTPSTQQVALMGLCDGASAALLYLLDHPDARVQGLALLNPWVRSDQTLAKAHVQHYYRQRLTSLDFWMKLLRGGVGLGALGGFVSALKKMSGGTGGAKAAAATATARPKDFRLAMRLSLQTFGKPVLLALSEDDLTAREFEGVVQADAEWQKAVQGPQVSALRLQGADHTLSASAASARYEQAVVAWLGQVAARR